MKKTTVVIPNYNNETCLRKCIDSVLNQDYSNKEIIIVDDSSTDRSIQIIQEYAKKNDCVKFYKTNHVGPNVARKLGVEKSTGDYIMFVDSDDFLDPGAIRILVDYIEKYNVDIVRCESRRCSDDGKVAPILSNNESEKTIYHDEIMKLLTTGFKLTSLWAKLYKKKVFSDLNVFDLDLNFGEDLITSTKILGKLDKILVVPDVLYFYRDNNDFSLTHDIKKQQIVSNIKDRIFVSNEMLKFIDKNIHDEQIKRNAIYRQLRTIWEVIKRLSLIENYKKTDFYDDFSKCFSNLELIDDDIKELNKYIKGLSVLEKVKNGIPVEALAKRSCEAIWRNFCRYRFLRKIFGRGK